MPEQESRDTLLSEATRLFAEQGYAATSVREIVEAAGVTKPTLYYWFGSKEGLFAALVDHHINTWLARTHAEVEREGPVAGRLADYVRATFAQVETQPEVLRFLSQAFGQAGQGAPEVDSKRFHAEECQTLCALLKEGIARGELRDHDPLEGALALMGMVHMRMGASVHGGPPLTEATASGLIDFFLRGVTLSDADAPAQHPTLLEVTS